MKRREGKKGVWYNRRSEGNRGERGDERGKGGEDIGEVSVTIG